MKGQINDNEFAFADSHHGHSKIIEYEGRAFHSVEHMDEVLIQNWNQVVKKKDKIWHLGDFSFYGKEKTREIVSRLQGYKILIMGNHDRHKSVKWWHEVGFDEVYRYPILRNGILFSHEKIENDSFYNIHGHLHSKVMDPGYKYDFNRYRCVSAEPAWFHPMQINRILAAWQLDRFGNKKPLEEWKFYDK